MTICSQCHYRYYNDDLRLDCCKAKQAPISNPVTGERYCETINKDGSCGFFRPDKRFLVRGMIIAGGLFLCAVLAWPLEKRAQQRQFEVTEKAHLEEIKVEKKETEEKIKAQEKAKFPAKIYKGTYNGKEFIIEEYETYRDK